MSNYTEPIDDEDYQRSRKLADFLANKKWTIGQAKRAFAVWFVVAGGGKFCPLVLLESELNDFKTATLVYRNHPTAVSILGSPNVYCDTCMKNGEEVALPMTIDVLEGRATIMCAKCGTWFKKERAP